MYNEKECLVNLKNLLISIGFEYKKCKGWYDFKLNDYRIQIQHNIIMGEKITSTILFERKDNIMTILCKTYSILEFTEQIKKKFNSKIRINKIVSILNI